VHVLTSRTIVHPSDLEASLAFYGWSLDLPVAREFGTGAGRGVVFFAGGGLIEVVGSHQPKPVGPSGSSAEQVVALWLQVRSVADTVDELTGRGVELARGATLEPWGLIEAWVDDPDGIRIHLVEVPADHPLRRDQRDLAIGGGRP
jgi:predicted enzyme related to lactoylglutathione lyase